MKAFDFISKELPESSMPDPVKKQWAEIIEKYHKEKTLEHIISIKKENIHFREWLKNSIILKNIKTEEQKNEIWGVVENYTDFIMSEILIK